MVQRELSIDLETFSSVDLKNCGTYKYVTSPDFEIILFAYGYETVETINGKKYRTSEPVHVVDILSGEEIPRQVIQDLYDPAIIKTAHNAAFEIPCLNSWLFKVMPVGVSVNTISKRITAAPLDPAQWRCSMIKGAMLGLPMSLDMLGNVLHIKTQKMKDGFALIKTFCIPCKPTKVNNQRTRNLPKHEPEKWMRFKEYNAVDVIAEREIKQKLDWFDVPQAEQAMWVLDQKINATGICIDPVLCERAITIDNANQAALIAEAVEVANIGNIKSVHQLKKWLAEEAEEYDDDFDETASLTKDKLPALIKRMKSDRAKRVLEIRMETSKTSVKKYTKLLNWAIPSYNHRVYGMFQFMGANRTGRWAGRGPQPQNFPRNSMGYFDTEKQMDCLDTARRLVKGGYPRALGYTFDSISSSLSQLLRTCFVPSAGNRLIPSDFSAIEARVLAWLANEEWVLEVFRTHGKIYEATASMMFNIPIEQVTKTSPWRQAGKVGDLAGGYGGGAGAFMRMAKANNIVWTEAQAEGVKLQWRAARPATVEFWAKVQRAAVICLTDPINPVDGLPNCIDVGKGVFFRYEKNSLTIELPSGRKLFYCGAYYDYESSNIVYWGVNQTSKQWMPIKSYGGKFVENIVQAIARDLLVEAMKSVDAAGYKIVMHVHDEVITEMPIGKGSVEELNKLMCPYVAWAEGLPLKAEGFETMYYRKED